MSGAAAAMTCRWPIIPACWPTATGACGCGHHPPHPEKSIGKATLVGWTALVHTPPTAAQITAWAQEWPACNWAGLLEPLGALVVDLDGEAARGEAIGLGLPPAIVATTGKGSHYYYSAPPAVVGKRATHCGQSKQIDVLAGGIAIIPDSRHRSGRRYEWIIPPTLRALTPAPAWAVAWLRAASEPTESRPAVELPATLPPRTVGALRCSPRIAQVIQAGIGGRYRSRSEAVFGVIQALIQAGHDDAAIASVLLDPAHGISAKPRELGRRWVAREIARARAKADVVVLG